MADWNEDRPRPPNDGPGIDERAEGVARRAVLLIDDQAAVRRSVGDLLERSGFAVTLAVDGEDGLRLFREHIDEIDVVLLDLTLPRMSGADVFEQIRDERAEVPVVLASGYGDLLDDPRLVDQPRTTFLAKPFRLATLLQTLQEVLGD